MIKKSSLVALFGLFATILMNMNVVYAWDVTLTWDPNSESDLAGYNLYHTNVQGVYDYNNPEPIALGPTDIETIVVVPDGLHCWTLTAFDLVGNESGPSNECCIQLPEEAPDHTPPLPPTGVEILDAWQ